MNRAIATTLAGLTLATLTLSACSSSESATLGDPTAIPEVTVTATPSADPAPTSSPTPGQEAPQGQTADLQNLTLEKKTVKIGDKVTVDIDPSWFKKGNSITVIIDNREVAEVDPKADPASGVMTFDALSEGTTRVGVTQYKEGTEPDLNNATFVGYDLTVTK